MAFNTEKSIISQSAGKDAAAITAALVSQGALGADEALEFFQVARSEMVASVLELAGGEPEDAPANSGGRSGGFRSGGGRGRSGGGRAQTNDNGAGVVIRFGKHQGSTIQQVFDTDPDYLDWLVDNATSDFIRDKVQEFKAAVAA